MKPAVLRLIELTKRYDRFTAVNGINLEISEGEIFGFLGPNGAGKTTTIKMIAGLLKADEGSIVIEDHDMANEGARCRALTGYIPDRPYLYEKLTGAEYLHFISSLYPRHDSNRYLSAAENYLDMFDITRWRDNLIESYSHGMRQKLIMSSIFMLGQPLILVDEPMVGLDPKSARVVKELFRQKAAQGTTIFLSTHSMEIAEQLCDRVAIIVDGAVIALGSIAELKQSARHQDAHLEDIFLHLTGAGEMLSVITALQSNGRD
jgi:ABC-2 type transport system ATP-binding protein